MSRLLGCLLLWSVAASLQGRTPDVTVTCSVARDCLLPCSLPPGARVSGTLRWFHQDLLVYSSEQGPVQTPGRASVPDLPQGNGSLLLSGAGLKDRGTYSCQVQTPQGEQRTTVVLKMEAPVRAVALELSRLSGYEEFRCGVHGVYPAPRVTWATEPPTFEDLRPMTRILADPDGLFTLDSRLRRLEGRPDLVYVCRVLSSYGGPVWTASLRERDVTGAEGHDLTVPCLAPPSISGAAVSWSFSGAEAPTHILTYDSVSGHSEASPPWSGRVELDGFRVPFGDASLRLMEPDPGLSGTYACVLSTPERSHTERSAVAIQPAAPERREPGAEPSHWWVLGLGVAVLLLLLAAMLVYVKLRGHGSKPRSGPEEASELHPVKEPASPEGGGALLGVRTGSC